MGKKSKKQMKKILKKINSNNYLTSEGVAEIRRLTQEEIKKIEIQYKLENF